MNATSATSLTIKVDEFSKDFEKYCNKKINSHDYLSAKVHFVVVTNTKEFEFDYVAKSTQDNNFLSHAFTQIKKTLSSEEIEKQFSECFFFKLDLFLKNINNKFLLIQSEKNFSYSGCAISYNISKLLEKDELIKKYDERETACNRKTIQIFDWNNAFLDPNILNERINDYLCNIQ